LHEMLTILLFSFSLHSAPHQNLLAITLFLFLLLAGLLLHARDGQWGGRRSVRGILHSHLDSIILGLYLFVPVAGLFLISLGMPIFTDRYLITVVPAFLLLLAGGLVAVRERSKTLAVVCLGLVLLSNLYVVALQGHTRIKSDFRSAAGYVEEDGRGDLMVFLIPHGRQVYDYYYEDEYEWVDAPYTNTGLGPDGVAREMEEATAGHHEVWLIVTEAELWDSGGLVQDWFERRDAPVEKRSFARVDVYLYALESAEVG